MRLQADVHKINHAGQSPLHFAAASASLQVTSLLLDHDSVSNQVLGVFMGNHWMNDWIDTWEDTLQIWCGVISPLAYDYGPDVVNLTE